jgi:hypothetical protein
MPTHTPLSDLAVQFVDRRYARTCQICMACITLPCKPSSQALPSSCTARQMLPIQRDAKSCQICMACIPHHSASAAFFFLRRFPRSWICAMPEAARSVCQKLPDLYARTCQICMASIPHHSALAAFFFLRRFQALLDIQTFPTGSSVLGTASVLAVTAPPPCTATIASQGTRSGVHVP